MDFPVRGSRQRQQASFFHVLSIDCQQKVWPRSEVELPTLSIQIQCVSSHFEASGLKLGHPLQMIKLKKIPHKCAQPLGFQLTPDVALTPSDANQCCLFSHEYVAIHCSTCDPLQWPFSLQRVAFPLSAAVTASSFSSRGEASGTFLSSMLSNFFLLARQNAYSIIEMFSCSLHIYHQDGNGKNKRIPRSRLVIFCPDNDIAHSYSMHKSAQENWGGEQNDNSGEQY